MSRRLVIIADATRLRALHAPGAAEVVEMSWSPDAPTDAVSALRVRVGAVSSVTLVVGLGFLEIARPELPPLDDDVRQALLVRDADRYFPVEGPVAAAWIDGLAFAARAQLLDGWVDAFSKLGTVDSVASVVHCVAYGMRHRADRGADPGADRGAARGARAGDSTYALDGDAGERALLSLRAGTVHDVHREPQAHGTPREAIDVDARLIAAGAAAIADRDDVPAMLLSARVGARLRAARRARWTRSAAGLLVALMGLGWSADRWRARELESADAALRALTTSASPARASELRLSRALEERVALDSGASARAVATTLATLGRILPRDAFVERLEWDGDVWRIDGSASDAPRIVPLLDGDPAFADVRIVAASTRFVDGTSRRESFSIAFRTRATGAAGPNGGTDAGQ